MKTAVWSIVLAAFLVILVLAFNTATGRRRQKFPWDDPPKIEKRWELDRERLNLRAERLAASLTIPTVSYETGSVEGEAFLKLHEHLRKSFPLIHSSDFIKLTVINQYSLLYKIQGKKENSRLPYMLAAHLDVVPVSNETWTLAEPFKGSIIDGVIYGRGALDDKSSVMGVLEALEFLLEKNHIFERTIYIAFGHDEELSGFEGAGNIAKHLNNQGIKKLDFVLDEGYFVLKDIVDGVDELVSVIGVTEKGYATLELTATSIPGHSSTPPKETAIGILAKAVTALEQNPHRSMFGAGPEVDFFSYLSPSVPWDRSIIFSNLWLFSPLLSWIISLSPVTDSIQRTTTAVTIIQGGYKENIIPGSATAIINHRIHPSDSLEMVLEHNRRVIGDPRVSIKVVTYLPPTPVSPFGPEVASFSLIARSVKQIFPTSVVAPACSPGNTDLRRYVELSDHLYRINPTILTPVTKDGIHGDDERISIDHYHDFIQFYVTLMLNAETALDSSTSSHQRQEL